MRPGGWWRRRDEPRLRVLAFLLALGAVTAALVWAAVPLYFPGQVPVPVYQITNRVLALDHDGDGTEELVVGTEGDLLVLIGYQEGGQFPLLERFPLAGAATDLALLPIAAGQDTLLAVATRNPDRIVLVEYRPGDEPFAVVGQIALEEDPGSMVVAPVGMAEQPGFVVALPGIDRLVLVSEVDGVWGIQQRIDTGDRPTSVAMFDVSGDGTPEIVTADSGVLSQAFSVFTRESDGSYVLSDQPIGPANPLNLATFDQDGDGDDELFVAHADAEFISIFVAVGGMLTEQERIATPLLVDALLVTPITGDALGLLSWSSDRGLVHYYLRVGAAWSLVETFFTGGRAGDLAPLDLNADGYRDLAVANGAAETIAMLFGNNLPSFRAYPAVHLPGAPVGGVTYDEDGDGSADVIVACQSSRTIERLLNDGTGHLDRQPDALVLDIEPSHLVSLDADGDAWEDLAVAQSFADRIEILRGQADGGFAPAGIVQVGDAPVVVVTGDFDADTFADLAVANAGSDDLTLAYGAGDGSFPDVQTIPLSWPVEAICVVDLNGDPLPDLAVSAGDVGIQTVTNLGGRVFGQWRFYGSGAGAVSLDGADFDGDGDEDLVVANEGDDSLALLENLGSGLFSSNIRVSDLDGSPYRIVATDINLDERIDVVVSYAGRSEVAMVLNIDTWQFSLPVPFSSAQRPGALLVNDYNGDSTPDLVVFDRELHLSLAMLNVEPNPVPIAQPPLQSACSDGVLTLELVTGGLAGWRLTALAADGWVELGNDREREVGQWRQTGAGWRVRLTATDLSVLGALPDDGGVRLRLASEQLSGGGVTLDTPSGCLAAPPPAGPPYAPRLARPYPNPFNLAVRCDLAVARAGPVRAVVCDLAGREIAVLADGWHDTGTYPLVWDGRTGGAAAPAGTYLLHVAGEGGVASRKLILIK